MGKCKKCGYSYSSTKHKQQCRGQSRATIRHNNRTRRKARGGGGSSKWTFAPIIPVNIDHDKEKDKHE